MVITLTSDFGTVDGFAGALKGVIARECPGATIVDITHDVAPQDVVGGAFALAQAARFFPTGTVHVAVVDPGVGSARRALIVEHETQRFVGPDNGLLSLAAPPAHSRAHVVDRLPGDWQVHPTFHGRDVFARVAARLAAGDPVTSFASAQVNPIDITRPATEETRGTVAGEVFHVDHFGNLVTNLPNARSEGAVVAIGERTTDVRRTYADVAPGEVVAYPGSAGFVEIAVRDGSAARALGLARGARVTLERRRA